MNTPPSLSIHGPANDVDPLPRLSPQQLARRLGARTLERAERCDAWRAVFDARVQGRVVKASCEGSQGEAWRVSATLRADGALDARCSCPVGAEGACKHVGATLIAWRERPGRFARRRAVDARVESLDLAAAQRVLRDLAGRSPELEALVESALPACANEVEPTAPDWGERVGEAFRAHEGEDGAGELLADAIERTLADAAASLGPEQLAGVAAAHGQVLRALLGRARRLGEGAAPLRAIVRRCLDAMADAARRIDDDDARRGLLGALVDLVEFDIDRGVAAHHAAPGRIAVRLVVEAASPDDRAALLLRVRDRMECTEDWAHRVWSGVYVELVRGALDDARWLELCESHQRYASMTRRLLELERVDEALHAASRVADGEILELAEAFVAAGAGAAFEELLTERMRRTSEARRGSFAAWLGARVTDRRDEAAAAALAEQLFEARASRAGFDALKAAATRAGSWPEVRARAMDHLERAAHPLLAELLIDEGALTRAVEFVTSSRCMTPSLRGARETLVTALERGAPSLAARVLRAQAEALIAQRGRANYVDACAAIGRARRLMSAAGEDREAAAWIEGLRAAHAKRGALIQLLALHFGEEVREAS